MTLKYFESENYFVFLINNMAAYVYIPTQTQER